MTLLELSNEDKTDKMNEFQNMQDAIDRLESIESEKQNYYINNLNTLTTEQKNTHMQEIKDLATARANIYKQIERMYRNQVMSTEDNRTSLGYQAVALGSLEDQLNESEYKLNSLKDTKNNKLRMVKLNANLSKSYDARKVFIKRIFMYLLTIIIVVILSNVFNLSENIKNGFIGLIIVWGSFMSMRSLYDMNKRQPDNYDEIDWWWRPGDLNRLPSSPSSLNTYSNGTNLPTPQCYGPACCAEGTTWNGALQKCQPTTETAGFSNRVVQPFREHFASYSKF